MTRFVALGDSITLGVGDPVRVLAESGKPRRAWRGWAALLAEGLPEPAMYNLAGNGACIADVELHQLPQALPLQPDVASVVVGVNDTLRPNFDVSRIESAASHTIGALRAALGRAGRQWMLGRTWPAMCDELIGHYEAVLAAAGTLRAEASA